MTLRSFILMAGVGLLLTACYEPPYPGYKETVSGLNYKLHRIGDGERNPEKGDIATVHLTAFDWPAKRTGAEAPELVRTTLEIPMPKIDKGSFFHGLSLLQEGDSATLLVAVPIGQLDSVSGIQYDWSQHDTVMVEVGLVELQAPREYLDEIEQAKLRADQELAEQVRLRDYLADNGIGTESYIDGIYYLPEVEGTGYELTDGNNVFAHYRAVMLDGEEFNNTRETNTMLEFTLGKPDQVLPGFEIGVRQMRVGGKARFILPSQLGYGEYGSSTGVVPPFTTLIYEVEIIKVK